MKRFNCIPRAAALLILAAVLFAGLAAPAAVTFTVTPSAVSNTYNGYITLQITGLTSGQSVVVQKYLDANTNGVVDAGDFLMEQDNLTDGKPGMVIGGVTNFNVRGDTDGATNGAITALLNLHNGDILQYSIGKYLWVLTSTNAAFTPITNAFSITNFAYGQTLTGTVTNSAGAAVSNAMVALFPAPRPGHDLGTPLGSVVANDSGVYSIEMPSGTYVPVAFRSNYVGDYATSPVVTLTNGQTVTTNLALASATASISGTFVDATNSSKVLPGVFSPMTTSTYLVVGGFTGSNGTFSIPVISGTWGVGSDSGGLISHGYMGYNNTPTNVSAGATGVTIGFYKATALFYGNISDNLGNPIPGIAIESMDTFNNTNNYQQDGYTDINGNYVVGAVGGLSVDDYWQVSVDQNPTNYVFSQPAIQQSGGTTIDAGEAIQVDFTGLLATNYISGHVTTNGVAFAGVGVYAYANVGDNYFQTVNVDTDSNGNYTLSVANSNTWNVTFNYNCCTNCGGSDGLNNFGNYQNTNVAVNITNNNGTANFAVQLCAGVQIFTNTLPGGQVNNFYDYCCLQGTTCSGNQYWSTTDPNFPPGLNLNGNGEINGEPQNSGTYTFSVMLTDSCSGNSASQPFSITIIPATPPLQITTGSLPNGTNGAAYSTNLQATGGVLPYDWSLEPGSASLPNGLTLSTNGLISGVPSAAVSNYEFIVQVMDTNGDFNSATLSIYVTGGAAPLQITTTNLPNGTNGVFYSQALSATGGQSPYSWSLAPGSANLPANLALGTNGVISGTPVVSGTNLEFIVQATDNVSSIAQRVLSLTLAGSTNTVGVLLVLVRPVANGTLEFTFTGANGVNYSVQSSPDLNTWTTVLSFTGSGATETISAPTTGGGKAAYYRVKIGP